MPHHVLPDPTTAPVRASKPCCPCPPRPCRVGPDNSTARSDTSYLAPLTQFAITPNLTYTYDVYIAAGRLDQIRATFARIEQNRKNGTAQPQQQTAPAGPAAAPRGPSPSPYRPSPITMPTRQPPPSPPPTSPALGPPLAFQPVGGGPVPTPVPVPAPVPAPVAGQAPVDVLLGILQAGRRRLRAAASA
jgi:hypothetical protein